jgi:hypothetical protein
MTYPEADSEILPTPFDKASREHFVPYRMARRAMPVLI